MLGTNLREKEFRISNVKRRETYNSLIYLNNFVTEKHQKFPFVYVALQANSEEYEKIDIRREGTGRP